MGNVVAKAYQDAPQRMSGREFRIRARLQACRFVVNSVTISRLQPATLRCKKHFLRNSVMDVNIS